MKKIVLFFALIGLLGCQESNEINKGLLEDAPVNIEGSWQITQVFQNQVDITDAYDFSTFQLTLNYSNSMPSDYSITSNIATPFVTDHMDGSWKFDNVAYPYLMNFIQGDTATLQLAEPLLPGNGNEILVFAFNMGCSEIEYEYHLTKTEQQ